MKKALAMLAVAALALSLAACSGGAASSAAPAAESAPAGVAGQTGAEAAEAGTVTITHELGETELAPNPEKILIMDLSIVDILDTVGIDIGGLPASNLPGYLSKFSDGPLNTGSLKEIDFEAVNEYGPDLIVISGRLSDAYDDCSEIAPTIYLPMPGATYLETMQANVEILAQVFPARAQKMNDAFAAILENAAGLKAQAEQSGLNALVLLANDGSLSVYGAGSRYGIIHDDLGFAPADEAIDASTHGQEASFEYIQQVNPDVIFVIDRSAAIGTEGASGAATLLDNELVNSTTAAQEGRIVYLSSDVWYLATGGLTGTQAMLDEVAAALG